MSQSVWKFLKTVFDNEDWMELTTRAISNGAVMEGIGPLFQTSPWVAREWGFMIRSILVLLWGLSCSEDDWKGVTGERCDRRRGFGAMGRSHT